MTHTQLIEMFLNKVSMTAPDELGVVGRLEYLREILQKYPSMVDLAAPELFGLIKKNPFTGATATPIAELAILVHEHGDKIENPAARSQVRYFVESIAREADARLTARQLAEVYGQVEHPTFTRPEDLSWSDYWALVERRLKDAPARERSVEDSGKIAPPTLAGPESQRIEALETALAACRAAFPIPKPGDPAEQAWAAAMGDPLSVPEFVRAQAAAMKKAVQSAQDIDPEHRITITVNDQPIAVTSGEVRIEIEDERLSDPDTDAKGSLLLVLTDEGIITDRLVAGEVVATRSAMYDEVLPGEAPTGDEDDEQAEDGAIAEYMASLSEIKRDNAGFIAELSKAFTGMDETASRMRRMLADMLKRQLRDDVAREVDNDPAELELASAGIERCAAEVANSGDVANDIAVAIYLTGDKRLAAEWFVKGGLSELLVSEALIAARVPQESGADDTHSTAQMAQLFPLMALTVEDTPKARFEFEFESIKLRHADFIAEQAAQAAGMDLDDLHWDLIDTLKDQLGAAEANASSDDAGAQEGAISSAEGWVADNVSNEGIETSIALAIYMHGLDGARERLAAAMAEARRQQPGTTPRS